MNAFMYYGYVHFKQKQQYKPLAVHNGTDSSNTVSS